MVIMHSWPRRSGKTTECARLCRELGLPYYTESGEARKMFAEKYPDIDSFVFSCKKFRRSFVFESFCTTAPDALMHLGKDFLKPSKHTVYVFGTFGRHECVHDYRRLEDAASIRNWVEAVEEGIMSWDIFYRDILNIGMI